MGKGCERLAYYAMRERPSMQVYGTRDLACSGYPTQ